MKITISTGGGPSSLEKSRYPDVFLLITAETIKKDAVYSHTWANLFRGGSYAL